MSEAAKITRTAQSLKHDEAWIIRNGGPEESDQSWITRMQAGGHNMQAEAKYYAQQRALCERMERKGLWLKGGPTPLFHAVRKFLKNHAPLPKEP